LQPGGSTSQRGIKYKLKKNFKPVRIDLIMEHEDYLYGALKKFSNALTPVGGGGASLNASHCTSSTIGFTNPMRNAQLKINRSNNYSSIKESQRGKATARKLSKTKKFVTPAGKCLFKAVEIYGLSPSFNTELFSKLHSPIQHIKVASKKRRGKRIDNYESERKDNRSVERGVAAGV
jgi:hypothetical protein